MEQIRFHRFQMWGHIKNESHLQNKDAEEGKVAELSLPSYSTYLQKSAVWLVGYLNIFC